MQEFIVIPVSINEMSCIAMIDTGANIHIISDRLCRMLHLPFEPSSIDIKQITGFTKSIGRVKADLRISNVTRTVSFHVMKDFNPDLLLGIKLGDNFDITLNLKKKQASIRESASHTQNSASLKQHSANKAQATQPERSQKQAPLHPHLASSNTSSNDHNNQLTKASPPSLTVEVPTSSTTDPSDMGCTPSSMHHADTRTQLELLLSEFSHLFSHSDSDMGRIELTEHRIRIPENHPPIANRPYRRSPAYWDEVRRIVVPLLKNQIIRDSVSPYRSNVTLATKPDGSKRLCIDYRKLNEITIKDQQPLPRIQDVVDRMRDASCFSKVDLKSGYWQVPMHPLDIEKTAFVTADGQYEWLVMPFGLKNAPATFQRVIQKILGKLLFKNCINYLDDIIIFSQSRQQHLEDLREVFETCMRHDARFNREKCEFMTPHVEFLGSLIGNNEVRPGKRKLQAVLEYPRPKSVPEVQRFLGMVNWFRPFIPEFADKAYPLTQLLRKDTPFNMGPEQMKAFETLKQAMCEKPVLSIFDPKKTCVLFTDASKVGIAGILTQTDMSQGASPYPPTDPCLIPHPIAYFSRRISPQQENWHATDLESLALVESVEHFKSYLEGKHFYAYTDHSALVWIKNSAELTGKKFRWFSKLSTYEMTILHKKGRLMAHVDALSRAPLMEPEHSVHVVYPFTPPSSSSAPSSTGDASSGILHHPPLIISYKASLQPLTLDEIRSAQKISDMSFVKNPMMRLDIIHVKKNNIHRAAAPPLIRTKVINHFHELFGHPGVNKTSKLVAQYFWWPNLQTDVISFCRSCPKCQLAKPASTPTYGKLQPLPACGMPLELVSMDTMIMGSVARASHAKNLQVVIDHHSRYCWAYPTPTNTLPAVCNVLSRIFSGRPWPQVLLTDQGSNFLTPKFKKFLMKHGTRHIMSSPYHPQTNGVVEKMNRTLKNRLQLAALSHPKLKWSSLVDEVVKQYNSTPHDVTGYTPHFLMFGMHPASGIFPPTAAVTLEEARRLAQERTALSQTRRKERYDDKHPEIQFCPGDLVKREIPRTHPSINKLSPRFEGPFTIHSQTGPNTYQYWDDDKLKMINVSRLRPWFEPLDSSPDTP